MSSRSTWIKSTIPSVPSTVQNSVWGPPLWKFLHCLAEKIGNQKQTLLQIDELNLVIKLLRKLTLVLPCFICRKHYSDWLRVRPPEEMKEIKDGPGRRNFLRHWLYDLHCAVNRRREIVSDPISWDELPVWTNGLSMFNEYDTFYLVLQKAMEARSVNRDDVLNFRQIVTQLRGIF